MTVINVTDLARNLSHVLDRIAHGEDEIVVMRKSHAVARLVPSISTMTAAEAMADLGGAISSSDAAAWQRDIAKFDRRADREMRDPWES